MIGETVWLLSIGYDGEFQLHSIHANEEGAKAALYEYVKERWDRVSETETMPASPGEAINEYFGSNNYDRKFMIEPNEIQP